jgi:hypothetical protein
MSDKKRNTFSTLCFVLLLKTSVLSLVHILETFSVQVEVCFLLTIAMTHDMTKMPFVATKDSSLQTLGLTYDKDASTYTSSAFDFVATGLLTIQFLFFV